MKKIYHVENKILGAGAFGKVFLGKNKMVPDHKVAIKVLDKHALKEKLEDLLEEFKILQSLDHPNIVNYYESYKDKRFIYLVMEHCPNGNLIDLVIKKAAENEAKHDETKRVEEPFFAEVFHNILQALQHCHMKGIIHRDIKPDNIMMGKDNEIKLIDFGLAKKSQGRLMKTQAGTPYYMAPEVLKGDSYGPQCDMWGIGVMLYLLLSGYYPYNAKNMYKLREKIQNSSLSFERKEFKYVSELAKDFIRKALQKDPSKRMTVTEALNHDWIKYFYWDKKQAETWAISSQVVDNLRKFRKVSKLKKAALNVMVDMLDPLQIYELRELFERIDSDNSGTIEPQELLEALKKSGHDISLNEIEKIIESIDFEDNHKINYTTFLTATLSIQNFLTVDRLKAVFNSFDVDQSGKISIEDVGCAMEKFGLAQNLTQRDLEQMIKTHDLDKDGDLDFSDFKTMMMN